MPQGSLIDYIDHSTEIIISYDIALIYVYLISNVIMLHLIKRTTNLKFLQSIFKTKFWLNHCSLFVLFFWGEGICTSFGRKGTSNTWCRRIIMNERTKERRGLLFTFVSAEQSTNSVDLLSLT